MDRTIKIATLKRHRCDSHDQVRQHFANLRRLTFARRLRILRGPTLYEAVRKARDDDTSWFPLKPAPPITGTKQLDEPGCHASNHMIVEHIRDHERCREHPSERLHEEWLRR